MIYRTPDGIAIDLWSGVRLRSPRGADGTVSSPAIGGAVAAWEVGAGGGRDVQVAILGTGEEYVLEPPRPGATGGDQFAPAAHGDLVAYVDSGDHGAVWVHDTVAKTYVRVCDGVASGVSIGGDGTDVAVAVARAAPGAVDDIEVYDLSGNRLAALAVPGVQRNPHLSRDWVAFEDVSTAFSQVILWNWRTGLVFLPHATATQQVLNDVSVAPEEVRVVFEDTASPASGRDIVLYSLRTNPIELDDRPNGYPFDTGGGDPPEEPPGPASCDDPDATPLAVLELGRDTGKPLAGDVAFDAAAPAGALALPVLVCVDAERVSSAWLTLDDEAIASPGDFEPEVVRLERRAVVTGGHGLLSGVIAGKPGASLRVRVLADPGRAAGVGVTMARAIPSSVVRGHRCGSAGAGAGSLVLLAALLATRGRRRA